MKPTCWQVAGTIALWSCAAAAALPGEPAGSQPAVQEATVRIRAGQVASQPIPRYITGKFCEHLGTNIYNGMDAQILRNPTFAEYPFRAGQTPDGVGTFRFDRREIVENLRRQAARIGWPEAELDRLAEAYEDALACFWIREGGRQDVQTSPDTGPHGGRAQRVEVKLSGQGIAQWTPLPLHRVRKYQFEVLARSPELTSLSVALLAADAQQPLAKAALAGLGGTWGTLRGELELGAAVPADAPYRLAITADSPGQFVVARALLRPADHVGGADPDVVRLLKDSRLPILRWPGGNFVSGYHWEDGIGPVDARLTRPNYGWGGVETNLFGTDEFIAFCRSVGCEPMICINAGSGTPDEAARWIQYCNGPVDSPLGKRRAAGGHAEPFRVRHWEIGNEIYGRWQYYWTTPAGYVDRFQQFRKAMLGADPTVKLYACGTPVKSDTPWNRTLIRAAGPTLGTLTDHPLIGGTVPASTDPMDVYRDFMAVPDVLAGKWSELQREMQEAGVPQPRLAVTELQLFAGIGPAAAGQPVRLTRENFVSQPTLTEGLYNLLIYHHAIRLAPFVEMVTHSATVNHGGGLRKERERVYANPCHWAQAGFAALAGARPVAVEVTSPQETAPRVLSFLSGVTPPCRFEAIDALAARADDGSLLLSIVHRGTAGPIRVSVRFEDFAPGPKAELHLLTAEVPWAANTLQSPDAVRPQESTTDIRKGELSLVLRPFTWVRVRIPRAPATR